MCLDTILCLRRPGARWLALSALSPRLVADALSALYEIHPGVRDRVITEQGQVCEQINIFVGDENIRFIGSFATPVPPNSDISIVPAVSGG